MKTCSLFLIISLIAIAAETKSPVEIRSSKADFRLETVSEDLENPWSIGFTPEGILITERRGKLKLFSNGALYEIAGLPEISSGGQGGLLDIAVSPDYANDRMIFFTFVKQGSSGRGTALASAKLNGRTLENVKILWEMNRLTRTSIHFGSRLRFLKDGTIIFTTGDRGDSSRAQDLSDSAGKVHRIKRDGSIPSDNPFINTTGAVKSIYSYGHRNSQGIAVRGSDGTIWLSEHGPQGGDEINLIRKSGNYGWPVITYGRNYGTGTKIGEGTSKHGMEQPLLYWSPSIAPSGLEFYSGSLFPQWKGNLFSGALAGERLVRIEISGNNVTGQELLIQGIVGRIRDVRESPEGYIYFITDEKRGALYRITPRIN